MQMRCHKISLCLRCTKTLGRRCTKNLFGTFASTWALGCDLIWCKFKVQVFGGMRRSRQTQCSCWFHCPVSNNESEHQTFFALQQLHVFFSRIQVSSSWPLGCIFQLPKMVKGFILILVSLQLTIGGDQRYVTPRSAVLDRGADVIIVGRGITGASDPLQTARQYR